MTRGIFAVLLTIVFAAPAAEAWASSHQCAARKATAISLYTKCMLRADASSMARETDSDDGSYERCRVTFTERWQRAEVDGTGECWNGPGEAYEAVMRSVEVFAGWVSQYLRQETPVVGSAELCGQAQAELNVCTSDRDSLLECIEYLGGVDLCLPFF
jgi:hypothetical protein